MLASSACHLAVQVPKVGRHSLLSPLFARLVIGPHVLQLYEESMKTINIIKAIAVLRGISLHRATLHSVMHKRHNVVGVVPTNNDI